MMGTGAAELAMEYAGAPPMSGLSFLTATAGTAFFQVWTLRYVTKLLDYNVQVYGRR
jgi:hypothetical protein